MVRYFSLLYLKIDLMRDSQLWNRADLDTSFASLKNVLSQPEIKCTRRIHLEESPSFNKITREMNQIHWRANNHFIYLENRCKQLRVRGKSIFLALELSTMIQTSRNFSPLLTFESIRRCLDKSIGEFSMVYIYINECSDMAQGL